MFFLDEATQAMYFLHLVEIFDEQLRDLRRRQLFQFAHDVIEMCGFSVGRLVRRELGQFLPSVLDGMVFKVQSSL